MAVLAIPSVGLQLKMALPMTGVQLKVHVVNTMFYLAIGTGVCIKTVPNQIM